MLYSQRVGSTTMPATKVNTTDGTPGGPPVLGTGQSLISTSQSFYDAAGNVIETISPSGLRTGTIYNINGTAEYTGILNASYNGGTSSLPRS